MIDPNFDSIPTELREQDQWVVWEYETRDGDRTKVPYQPDGRKAKSNDPSTWSAFSEVRNAYERNGFSGIGLMFSEDGPFAGIDLDKCLTDGELTGGARKVTNRLDSYTEGSPSGTGLHIICQADLFFLDTETGKKSKAAKGMKELEVYDQGRYFTFTGRHLEGTPERVENRAQEVYSLCQDVFGTSEQTPSSTPTQPNDLEDRELIETAKNADDGGKFERLWRGDISAHDNDHSRADQALVSKLVFYTGGDRKRVDRLFRQSGLCREKWTERADYRERTIDKALEGRTEFYNPSNRSKNRRKDGHAEDSTESKESDPWAQIRSTYEEDKGQARVDASDQLIDELSVATHLKSRHLYVWDAEDHVYADEGEQAIQSVLVDKLKANFSQREVREIIGMVKPKTYRSEFGKDGFVPVANGDLKISENSVDLKDPTPERGFRNRSPAKWDPNAGAPIFKNYLRDAVPSEDDRKALQEYAGYSLMYWGLPFHKALFLVGPQASGKSTFLKTIQELLGKTTQLSPQQLVDDDYGAIELEDSWANVASDIPDALVSNVGRFKEITAGDRIYVERKYEQGYPIEPTAKHFYSANQLPDVKIDDNAFFRRVMIVPFPKTVPKEDRDSSLSDRLKLEADGILQWAVEGLQRLLESESFTRDLPPSKTRRLWDEHASSIGQFKVRHLNVTGESDHAVPKEEVYSAYVQFCLDKGLPDEKQRKLTRVLKRDPRIGDAQRIPPGFENQRRCYIGVELDTGGGDVPF